MSDKKNKRKAAGPYGVGETWEDIENLDVKEQIKNTEQSPWHTLTKDLNEEQLKYVEKETDALAKRWEGVLEQMMSALDTPEKQKAFKEAILKKAGQK